MSRDTNFLLLALKAAFHEHSQDRMALVHWFHTYSKLEMSSPPQRQSANDHYECQVLAGRFAIAIYLLLTKSFGILQ